MQDYEQRKYYKISSGHEFCEGYFICEDTTCTGKFIFGLQPVSQILSWLKRSFGNNISNVPFEMLASRKATDIWSSGESRLCGDDITSYEKMHDLLALRNYRWYIAKNAHPGNYLKQDSVTYYDKNAIELEDTEKYSNGGYYSIEAGAHRCHAYFICEDTLNTGKFIFGLKPAEEILKWLRDNIRNCLRGAGFQILASRSHSEIEIVTPEKPRPEKIDDIFKEMHDLLAFRNYNLCVETAKMVGDSASPDCVVYYNKQKIENDERERLKLTLQNYSDILTEISADKEQPGENIPPQREEVNTSKEENKNVTDIMQGLLVVLEKIAQSLENIDTSLEKAKGQ